MPTSYGQFCPVAKAMELLDERWTLLVVRELMLGSRHFNALRRGVPRMSPTLLSKRLSTLVRAGVVERWEDGSRVEYRLTEAGQELGPIVEALGRWGVRWIPEIGDRDLDPHLLMWDMHRNVDRQALPPGRTVVKFVMRDVQSSQREWWIVASQDEVDVCDADPGFDVRAVVEAPLRALTHVWRGDVSWREAQRAGDIRIVADPRSVAALPGWFTLTQTARTPRPTPVTVGSPGGS
jgi:DNA-binding HxlR family transcriptional regulator